MPISNMKDNEFIAPNAELKTNDKNKYKLFGTMSMFDFVPDFVYPVFENNGKYYFHNSDNSIEIDSFYEIYEKNHISRIKPFSPSFIKTMNINEYYTVGDEPLVAFQISEETFFIGTSDIFIEFIKNIQIDNEILSERITDFQNEIKLAKHSI